jgi:hypothetical protein
MARIGSFAETDPRHKSVAQQEGRMTESSNIDAGWGHGLHQKPPPAGWPPAGIRAGGLDTNPRALASALQSRFRSCP